MRDYTNTPEGTARTFNIEAVQVPVVYNKYGDYCADSMVFVLEEDADRTRAEAAARYSMDLPQPCKDIQPLVIRANLGDTIKMRFANYTDRKIAVHINGVSCQDSTDKDQAFCNDGLNYICYMLEAKKEGIFIFYGMEGKETYATDVEEFIYGLYGAVIVEPPGAKWHNPVGLQYLPDDFQGGSPVVKELYSGTKAVVQLADGTSYREFVLFGYNPCHPHKYGYKNPCQTPGVNYHLEPMEYRLASRKDTAYVFSSLVHGDPATPVLETYPGDRVVIYTAGDITARDGRDSVSKGCSGIFNIAGIMASSVEDFSGCGQEIKRITITGKYSPGDYLYYFNGNNAVKSGMWGIFRVYREQKKHLGLLSKTVEYMPPVYPPVNAIIKRYEIAAVDAVYKEKPRIKFINKKQLDSRCYNLFHRKYHGKYKALMLKADAGEWIEVILYNRLGKRYLQSMRVSLIPQSLKYDPEYNYGINAGYNKMEQTAAPGESRRYIWYAEKPCNCILQSFNCIYSQEDGAYGILAVKAEE